MLAAFAKQQSLLNPGLILVDRRGIVTFMDPGAAQLLKITPAEASGRRLTEFFPETRILEVYTTGQALCCEQTLEEAKINITYLPVLEDGELHSVLVCLQGAGAAGGEAEEVQTLQVLISLYEAILADLPLGIAVVNRQGRLVMLNKQYSQLLEIAQEEATGLSIEKVVPFTRMTEVMRHGEAFLDTGVRYRGRTLFLSEVPIKSGNEVLGGLSKLVAKESLEDQDLKDLTERFHLLESKLMFYKEELKELRRSRSPFEAIRGENLAIKKLVQLAQRVARGEANVLITGESGTGKGLFAQAIHNASRRNGEPFIKINCAAIPENLLESELFGYEEGAFTGAVRGGKPGKFELANGGTIFLDEIGDMPLAMQAKILRVLQEKTFERVGGSKTITVDVRVIAATNRDLRKLIDEQQFRLDLYYRLAVINLHIPPLRERRDDLLLLTREIIDKLGRTYGQKVAGIEPEVEQIFLSYSWPGNVRELENVLEHAFNFLDPEEQLIGPHHLPGILLEQGTKAGSLELGAAVAHAEIEAIRRALQLAGGNKQKAAKILGIHPSGLYQKLKKYAITDC
ncbi:sigma 54-interacting transcriptional regulator [Zhaonella formicivorans]|uniref:sigma 54-interacting transcriptional regulator n=1 Tax=Zhaonella formicivorans TaxID=2528593 RepID=UPI0010F224E5|nr:sigma 54-interacting transcriptional regulator [Zhaonella formicivorans]